MTNTLLGRSTGLILLIAVPIPSITWTGANKNKDKQNSPAEFVVQQGCSLVLCNNTRLYQADTVSIISVSSGKVTDQKACVFNGFRALAPYSHSLLGIVFNGFCFINLIPHFFDYLMCPYYPAYTMGCYQIVISHDNGRDGLTICSAGLRV